MRSVGFGDTEIGRHIGRWEGGNYHITAGLVAQPARMSILAIPPVCYLQARLRRINKTDRPISGQVVGVTYSILY